MTRVGVLGGTFDPLHLGHLRAAEAVKDAAGLDCVWFVPAASPPHKRTPPVTGPEHRVAMLERALADERSFGLSRVEVEREGPSYTIDTLERLEAEGKGDRFYFITGTDAFAEIRTWKRWDELLSRHWFVVHERPGFPIEDARRLVPGDVPFLGPDDAGEGAPLGSPDPRIRFVRRPMLSVSSTDIRQSVRENRSIRFLVPDSVEAYIRQFRLYR